MSVKKVVEIVGNRQSGRTTKLKELWFESLETDQQTTHVFIGTDIRAKETINHVWDLDHFMKVYVISPLGDLVKMYNRHKVVSMLREEGFDKLMKERNVTLFIDNISLNRTEEVVRELCSSMDVATLFYTGLTFHSGRNRKIVKEVFGIKDLGKLDFESIKLVREGE